MTQSQQLFFQAEFNAVRKSESTAVVLALFLSAVGAHQFYLLSPISFSRTNVRYLRVSPFRRSDLLASSRKEQADRGRGLVCLSLDSRGSLAGFRRVIPVQGPRESKTEPK